jgi:DNA-binding LytR/AlgR family response regulator
MTPSQAASRLRLVAADEGSVRSTEAPAGTETAGAGGKSALPGELERAPSTAAGIPDLRIAARSSGRKVVFLPSSCVWAFEARERLVFVHAPQGTFDIDVTLGELQSSLGSQFLRVHRNWLVSRTKIRELESVHGAMQLFAGGSLSAEIADRRGIEVPVARDRMKQVRQLLLADTFGVRPALRDRRRRPH